MFCDCTVCFTMVTPTNFPWSFFLRCVCVSVCVAGSKFYD